MDEKHKVLLGVTRQDIVDGLRVFASNEDTNVMVR